MIDSHTHLDSCAPPNAELVADARAVGVTHVVTVGMDERTNRTALAAAHEFPEVYAALGRHPNSAGGHIHELLVSSHGWTWTMPPIGGRLAEKRD